MSETYQKVDDADADARAAYAEVMSRTPEAETVAPEPVVDAPKAIDTTPDIVKTEQKPDGDRPRDEHGRFAPKSDKADADTSPTQVTTAPAAQAEQKPAETPAAAATEQPAAPAVAPPPSWSIKAKADWDKLPEHIRADVAKRETEVAEGYAALRDYKDLKPYADMARQQGTTLSAAMQHYVNMENVLRRDVGHGLALIAQNAGLSQAQAAELFTGLAQKFGGKAPGAEPAEADPLAEMINPLVNPIITPLQQKVADLERQLNVRAQQESIASQQALDKAITEFSADPKNRFFPDLADDIARLFESGMVKKTGNPQHDLQVAYDMAARMNPQVSEALIEQRLQTAEEAKRKREQEAAEKAKAASRSISGSRAPGTIIRDAEPDNGVDDVEADVRRAVRALSHA